MSAELNFILTLALLGILTLVCMGASSSKETRYLIGITKSMSYMGMGFFIIGGAMYYTWGLDGMSFAAPFFIVGTILNLAVAFKIRSEKNAIRSDREQSSETTGIINNDPEIVSQIAKVAKSRVMLVDRPHPTKPHYDIQMMKCPKCRYIFELATARIVGYTVYCPSCYKGTDLTP